MKERIDIRHQFFVELEKKLDENGIKAIVKKANSASGPTIKANGIALFKILYTPNPFGKSGVAIYKRLEDDFVELVGGKRAGGKNQWVSAPLNEKNYAIMMNGLFSTINKLNEIRNIKMARAIKKRNQKGEGENA